MTTATTQKWVADQPPTEVTVTRIAYRCGCTKTIGPWTKQDTPAVCEKHGAPFASVRREIHYY